MEIILSKFYRVCFVELMVSHIQGHHLSGKPGNVREFDSCQGNVR